jgi:hypothetical protein
VPQARQVVFGVAQSCADAALAQVVFLMVFNPCE